MAVTSLAGGGGSRGTSEDTMVGRCAQWVRASSLKSPEQITSEVLRVLKQMRVGFKRFSPSLVRCEFKALRFDVQINLLDQAELAYAVKLQRTAGEIGAYRELCARILAELQL